MNYVREYWERISSGEIVTSKRVKAVYGRLVAEMDAADENSPYYFDEAVGERPITFVERFCKQSQGTLGESLTLELFQKAFIQLLFGWLERATGYRRFRETLFLVGRKNGKSTLLAALALYMLVADYEGAAEIYSVATKKDQAKKTLTEAVNMVKQSPELSAILKKRRNDIYFPGDGLQVRGVGLGLEYPRRPQLSRRHYRRAPRYPRPQSLRGYEAIDLEPPTAACDYDYHVRHGARVCFR